MVVVGLASFFFFYPFIPSNGMDLGSVSVLCDRLFSFFSIRHHTWFPWTRLYNGQEGVCVLSLPVGLRFLNLRQFPPRR